MTHKRLQPIWRAALAAAALAMLPAAASGNEGGVEIPHQHWSFAGFMGHYDANQLQRGFQVYKEVCARCHSMRLVKFRNLSDPGGPALSAEQVKEHASQAKFPEISGTGKIVQRAGTPADPLPAPFANDQEARSVNNGALPPDFSVIAKARSASHETAWYLEPVKWAKDIAMGNQEGGADYIYALLTGYGEAPAYREEKPGQLMLMPAGQGGKDAMRCVTMVKGEGGKSDICSKLGEGMSYNRIFPGHQIGMPNPLLDGVVKYQATTKQQDGVKDTVEQYARDVTAFLMWAAEPKLEERKSVGRLALLYLIITALLLWLAKRRLWAKIEH